MSPNTETPNQRTQAQSGEYVDELTISSARRAELIQESREGIVTRLSELVASALIKMSEELTELATQREDREEQRILLDTVGVIKLHRLDIESRFRESFQGLFDQRLAGMTTNTPTAGPGDQEWTLVDDAAMRDKLKVQRLIDKARSKLDPDEVLGIRARLAALVNRDWFEESQHPASPEAVFEALSVAVDEIGSEAQVKSALLEAFAPYIAEKLNMVYNGANELLRQQDVLPRIKARVQINPDTGKPYKEDEVPVAEAGNDDETFILPKDGPEREAILEALAREVAAGGQEARTSAMQMLTQPENFGMADLPLPDPDAELIDALHSMQSEEHQAPQGNPGALTELTAQAREKGSPLDQLTVEIVSLIFDFLYQDPRIPQLVKNQLLRLQVVAVKAALLDRSFFASRQHPMRRLIDRATDISCDPETDASEGGAFTRGLTELVNTILGEFDRDLVVFERAVGKLDELESAECERRSGQLNELVRETEQDEAEAVARELAQAELEARCDNETPEFISSFLIDWWVDVMITARLEDSRNGEEVYWSARLTTAEQLVWTITPKSPDEVTQMAVILPKLIGGLTAGLKTVDVTEGQHARFFDELMKWHTKIIDRAKHSASRPRHEAAIRLDKEGQVSFEQPAAPAEDTVEKPTEVAAVEAQIDSMRRGQRFELRLEGLAPIPVKLAFVSPARKLFALSRFPDFAQSFDRLEFEQMLTDGELVPIDEKASIDRAIAAVGGAQQPDEKKMAAEPSGEMQIATLDLAEDNESQIPI